MTDEHDHPNEHPRHFATNPGPQPCKPDPRLAPSHPARQLSTFAEHLWALSASAINVQRHQLINDDGQIVQTFQPDLTELQQQVLDLLHIPANVYSSTDAS